MKLLGFGQRDRVLIYRAGDVGLVPGHLDGLLPRLPVQRGAGGLRAQGGGGRRAQSGGRGLAADDDVAGLIFAAESAVATSGLAAWIVQHVARRAPHVVGVWKLDLGLRSFDSVLLQHPRGPGAFFYAQFRSGIRFQLLSWLVTKDTILARADVDAADRWVIISIRVDVPVLLPAHIFLGCVFVQALRDCLRQGSLVEMINIFFLFIFLQIILLFQIEPFPYELVEGLLVKIPHILILPFLLDVQLLTRKNSVSE